MSDIIARHRQLVQDTVNTALSPPQLISMLCMGLAGEVGEVIEPLKKTLFHGKQLNVADLEKEIGDVLWYLHGLMIFTDMDMKVVLAKNIEKLRSRYPSGLSVPPSGITVVTEADLAAAAQIDEKRGIVLP